MIRPSVLFRAWLCWIVAMSFSPAVRAAAMEDTCRPCDLFALKCGYSPRDGSAASTATSYDPRTKKLLCTVQVTQFACKTLGLVPVAPTASPGFLKDLLSKVQDFSIPSNLLTYPTRCLLVHEITHALHPCDKTCTTEKEAYSAQIACLSSAAEATCTRPSQADFDSEWRSLLPCSQRAPSLYVPEGQACANVKAKLASVQYQLSWLQRRCVGIKPVCAKEPPSPGLCYYMRLPQGQLKLYELRPGNNSTACRNMETIYAPSIDAELPRH